jgi:single-strand DNA-binding protein
MYNKVVLVGNLARDIEIRYTQSGSAIGKTAIATNRKFKSQTGEQREEVMFIDLTFFGRTAEIANQYLRKGSKVLVDGRLTLEQWTAQDGSKRSKHSVTVENLQMLSGRDEVPASGGYAPEAQESYAAPTQQAQPTPQPEQASASKPAESNIPEIDIDDDEIPF